MKCPYCNGIMRTTKNIYERKPRLKKIGEKPYTYATAPFCSRPCVLRFARAAIDAGCRMIIKKKPSLVLAVQHIQFRWLLTAGGCRQLATF